MKIAIPKERRAHEARVAASPETVRKFVGLGAEVVVESGAGAGAKYADAAFTEAGAVIAADAAAALADADVILKVQGPLLAGEQADAEDEVGLMKQGAVLIAQMLPLQHRAVVEACAERGVTVIAMELMPRITRAQSMDVLSSQANLAGYKAVLDATAEFGRAMPMMMTAAGTLAPARVFVLGVGVAGLQAIATARRLGAIVAATDVRAETEEQVKSLGAKFVKPDIKESGEGGGGYAKEMSAEYLQAQAELVHQTLTRQDIAICTALIPGRTAPTLITEEMVHDMKPGSVIVDLAVEQGGNCAVSKAGEVVDCNGVRVIGHHNYPSRIAVDASALYAKNVFNFLSPHIDKDSKALVLDWEDKTVSGTLLCRDGRIVHPLLTGERTCNG